MPVDLHAVVSACLAEAMALDSHARAALSLETPLLGVHPDFNSMAALSLVTALEEALGLQIAEDMRADAFATVGSLIADLNHRLTLTS